MSAAAGATGAWPAGVARHLLPEVGSTNAEALRRAGAGAVGPFWLLALRQTAGRGRRGRAWVDPPGNFAGTLLTTPAGGPAEAARLSFVAALALHDALRLVCGPAARLALKWPNDVLLNGGKVAGILLESAGPAGQPAPLAIGIGVNLAAAPPQEAVAEGAVAPVSVVGETGHAIAPEAFLDLLAPAFAAREAELACDGFAAIRRAWLARAARLGETITARTGSATRIGRFEGIDDSGALVLVTAAGRETIPAADIFFG